MCLTFAVICIGGLIVGEKWFIIVEKQLSFFGEVVGLKEKSQNRRMAKKKRKTLPKNFDKLIKAGDLNALKAVFDNCELDATGGFNKETALHFWGISDELVKWLVEMGANINAENSYGKTPINRQSEIGSKTVELLAGLGADIEAPDRYGKTPLYTAAGFFHTETVKFLLERGASVHMGGGTPLDYALPRCRNTNIPKMADISELFLNAGVKVTSEMKESIKNIGKEFEFHRDNFNKESLAETDAGLARLYKLFDVAPVAKRRAHDGISPITVTKTNWQEQYDELWNYLVPSSGAAQTVQGEIIRITGRISHEVLDNGGCNWDGDFRKMLDSLLSHFSSGTPLSPNELSEAGRLASCIRPKGDGDDEPEHLCRLAVKWALQNPDPMPLKKPGYKR